MWEGTQQQHDTGANQHKKPRIVAKFRNYHKSEKLFAQQHLRNSIFMMDEQQTNASLFNVEDVAENVGATGDALMGDVVEDGEGGVNDVLSLSGHLQNIEAELAKFASAAAL